MVVGLLSGELFFPENHSLKEKRVLLQKIMARLKKELNVSVAEVDFQDLWQRSMIAVATVNTSSREATATLNRALQLLDGFYEAEMVSHCFEMR